MDFSDMLNLSYEGLMNRLSQPITKRIVGKVKRQLRSYGRDSGMMQTEEDGPLVNLWEEFCVQVQYIEFYDYDLYIKFIEFLIYPLVEACSEEEKIILWTQTQEYKNWAYDQNEEELNRFPIGYDMLKSECNTNSICDYILDALTIEAGNYSNNRIERYIYNY